MTKSDTHTCKACCCKQSGKLDWRCGKSTSLLLIWLLLLRPVVVQSIVINPSVCESVSLCVCVCLSVYPRAYLWNRWTDLHEFFCADPLWLWLGPSPVALWYVMCVWFYGWRHVWPWHMTMCGLSVAKYSAPSGIARLGRSQCFVWFIGTFCFC